MSKPTNPLAQYRTYSYHHVLIACGNTDVAEKLALDNEFHRYVENRVSRQSTSLLHDPIDTDVGRYVIITNNMVDPEFVITKLSWESLTAASSMAKEGHFTSVAVEGVMEVQEPVGVRFLNVLNDAANALDTDPIGITWMLKTIFVGHRDPSLPPDYIVNIKPLLFVIYDITAAFDVTGGIYNISFMGVNNGAGRLAGALTGTNTIKLNLSYEKADTLGGALKQLEFRLNEESTKHYESVRAEIREQFGRDSFEGKLVKYKIIAASPYVITNGSPNPDYKIDNVKTHNVDNGEEGEAPIIDCGGKDVESVIHEIMGLCTKIIEEGKPEKENTEGVTKTYKVLSSVQVTETEYQITYRVQQFIEPRSDLIQSILNGKSDASSEQVKRNLIEFDYIFTGQNTDIIDFDIKMEMGLAFFQTLSTSDNLADVEDAGRGNILSNHRVNFTPPNQKIVGTRGRTIRSKTPIFLSNTVNDITARNRKDAISSSQFQSALARHAALENLEVKLRITGNPSLLNATCKLPSEYSDTRLPVDRPGIIPSEDETFVFWETIPALAKVNIKMPTADPRSLDFAESFWYDGLYYVFSIKHEFSDGEFTQELDMMSLPTTSIAEPKSDETGPRIPPPIISDIPGAAVTNPIDKALYAMTATELSSAYVTRTTQVDPTTQDDRDTQVIVSKYFSAGIK